MQDIAKVIIARTDSLGDVALTVPLAGLIKQHNPDTIVAFLGTKYSKALVAKSRFVDEFYDWGELREDPVEGLKSIGSDAIIHVYPDRAITRAAKLAKIPVRIGVANRWFNLLDCNQRVYMRRKNSDLHESQLNMRLLAPLGLDTDIPLADIAHYYGWIKTPAARKPSSKKQIIFHPLSYGHGCEWPLLRWYQLAQLLDPEKFCIHITGSVGEGMRIEEGFGELFELPHVVNASGRYNLEGFIELIESADCVVASGTGPLHIAGVAGILAIGLYPPIRPIHPGRWGVIGTHAISLCQGELTHNKSNMHDLIGAISAQDCYRSIMENLRPCG